MNDSIKRKLKSILACPRCKSPEICFNGQMVNCNKCGTVYKKHIDTPILIPHESPVLKWYRPPVDLKPSEIKSLKKVIIRKLRLMRPSDRVWTQKSQKTIQNMLEEKNPDAPDSVVVLIGAGFEPVYKRICNHYQDIIRVGLAHRGDVDVIGEICDLPVHDEQLDLIFSSSVLEHVYNPERAVAEMYRALKPGGYVYAEIPFIRSFHMAPIDYQRYTISGIEELFARHGFTLIDRGICSGPFTALALYILDFSQSVLRFFFNQYIEVIFGLFLSIVVHPMKYLDRFFENSHWAEVSACNFYYLGKKDVAPGLLSGNISTSDKS